MRFNRAAGGAFLVVLFLVGATPAEENASKQLAKLFDDEWQFTLADSPLFATQAGDRRYNDQLPHVALANYERRRAAVEEFLRRVEGIDRSQLSRSEQISHEIFRRLKQYALAEYEFRSYLIPITNRSGFHIEFPELPRTVPLTSVEDYENYIARLAAFAQYTDEHIELLRAGIQAGQVLPSIVLRDYETPIRAHIVDDPEQSIFFGPFRETPEQFADADRARLADAGRQAIRTSIVPAYQAFLEFMTNEYVPAARGSIGASALPEGRAFYRHRVHMFTTLDVTPEEVHATGLAEVERIGREMREVMKQVDFDGDFEAFVEFLRTDPRFYAETPEQLMKEVSFALKKMDGELPKLFGTLPRMPYGIRPVPDYIAPSTTTAYYMTPAGDGTRAGFYYVNTYNLKSRPLYEVEALSLHEAVPGHHLQLALQQELEGIPPFQRFAGFTVFVEGWGLYAERLGLDAGFYTDPYQDFGRLSYEMWRACRLVVDTGMHYLGWTRPQAIEFMLEHSALARHNIVMEVDRYIAWPGQALAYKTGELKIRQLRARAEEELDEQFDLRRFHDAVLASGAVPLSILEENVDRFIRSTRDAPPSSEADDSRP